MAGHRFPNGMPAPSRAHLFLARLLGGSMTFWILYRGRQDMPVVLHLKHPWDHDGHHDSDSSHH
ncbi:11058_t:CDS:2 [Paraglomus occultum]|uniref:11058_t:CDS:1 n=1 Tax=Paraglomus occultum TaxID=144539 RepID=A0A9N9B546_9GLOM|nr:11058_t:CDS:2 [Paraglomus occultum]